MKLILFADGIVGLKIFNYLSENYHSDIALVVTLDSNEIYIASKKNNIPVCVYESEEALIKQLGITVDLGFLAWWPKILSKKIIDIPKRGFINTHPSLLPYNRGKNYNFWALVEQCPFGVSLHLVDVQVDSGDIVAQTSIPYDWLDTGKSLYLKAQSEMVKLFINTYPSLRTNNYVTKSQDLSKGSFHLSSELEKASKIELDSMYRACDLLNLLRARTFDEYPGCWFEFDNNRYEISINIKKVN